MGFCSCTVKFLLVIFNLVCAVAGIAILVVGILSNSQGSSFKQLLSGQVTTASICLMVLGAVIFLIAFFGCCGALREDICMIQTYGVILLIILIAEVAIAITAFVYKSKVEEALDDEGKKFFDNYDKNKQAIDEIQKEFHCCGYNNPYPSTVPLSCCRDGKNCTKSPEKFNDTCRAKIVAQGKTILNTIGAIALGIGVIELLGVICAFYVASSIRNSLRRGYA